MYQDTPPAPVAARRTAPVGLAVASTVIAVGVTLVQALGAIASVPAARDFKQSVLDGRGPYDVFTAYDALALLMLPALVAAWVVSCLWLLFARANTEVISPGMRHQRGKVWLWIGWWVPIVSFWFPFQVVRDIQAGSIRRGPQVGLGLWWAGWLVWLGCNRISGRVGASTDVDVLGALPVVEAIGTAALVVACVQWCRLVQATTAAQRAALAA